MKVICINDEPGWISKEKLLVKDEIYTVQSAYGNDYTLEGISGGWDKSRFRQIEDEWLENVMKKISDEVKAELQTA